MRYLIMLFVLLLSVESVANEGKISSGKEQQKMHGPSSKSFPSHRFQKKARRYPEAQISFHAGLIQPILLRGQNIATDFRLGRFVFEYSHGMNLDFPSVTLSTEDQENGILLKAPISTGTGVGFTLVDELYLMLELKVHRYQASLNGEQEIAYTSFTAGPALAWRFFIWKGLHANTYLRYWPTIASTLPSQTHIFNGPNGESIEHQSHDLGFFANISIGWAFDL